MLTQTFTNIYKENRWGGIESVSGLGSTLEETKNLRLLLEDFVDEYNIKRILDVPCGDFWWFSHINFKNKIDYEGWDIVPDLIQKNTEKYPNFNFKTKNIIETIPNKVDLILCRDLLVHLSIENILKTLNNFKQSKSIYLASTTFDLIKENENIIDGDWRQINLQTNPFLLGYPIIKIIDSVNWPFKKLAIWKIN